MVFLLKSLEGFLEHGLELINDPATLVHLHGGSRSSVDRGGSDQGEDNGWDNDTHIE